MIFRCKEFIYDFLIKKIGYNVQNKENLFFINETR